MYRCWIPAISKLRDRWCTSVKSQTLLGTVDTWTFFRCETEMLASLPRLPLHCKLSRLLQPQRVERHHLQESQQVQRSVSIYSSLQSFATLSYCNQKLTASPKRRKGEEGQANGYHHGWSSQLLIMQTHKQVFFIAQWFSKVPLRYTLG